MFQGPCRRLLLKKRGVWIALERLIMAGAGQSGHAGSRGVNVLSFFATARDMRAPRPRGINTWRALEPGRRG